MGHRGIFRIRIEVRPGEVRARADSKSVRGTPYAVNSVTVERVGRGKPALKLAVREAVQKLLPPDMAQ